MAVFIGASLRLWKFVSAGMGNLSGFCGRQQTSQTSTTSFGSTGDIQRRRGLLLLLAGGAGAAVTSIKHRNAAAAGLAPALLATNPPIPLPDLLVAQREAAALARQAHRAHAALVARIGPRAAVLGTLALPSGRTVAIHVVGSQEAKRLLRRLRLGDVWSSERYAIEAAISAASQLWDAQAEKAGLTELQERAAQAARRASQLQKAQHVT